MAEWSGDAGCWCTDLSGSEENQPLSANLEVRGAKPRAKMGLARIEPGSADEKWRISADTITVASACCTCVPGVLPLLRTSSSSVPCGIRHLGSPCTNTL